jgi:hypothetical protein
MANAKPKAATSKKMRDCGLPGAIAACAPLVITLPHSLLKPSVEPVIPIVPMPQPTAIHRGSKTATIAMMTTMLCETLRMSAVAGTNSFRSLRLRPRMASIVPNSIRLKRFDRTNPMRFSNHWPLDVLCSNARSVQLRHKGAESVPDTETDQSDYLRPGLRVFLWRE